MGTLIYTTTKIYRVHDAIVGYAGEPAFGQAMLAWLRAGSDPAQFPVSQRDKEDWVGLLVIRPGQPVLRYERTPFPVAIEDKCVAIGSGRDFAMAAMHLGLDARRAVKVAIDLDSGCGNGIDILSLQDA